MLYYDFCLTLSQEIAHIWSRPLSRPALLFFLNRYPMLLGSIAFVLFDIAGMRVTPEVRAALSSNPEATLRVQLIHRSVWALTLGTRFFLYSHKYLSPVRTKSYLQARLSNTQKILKSSSATRIAHRRYIWARKTCSLPALMFGSGASCDSMRWCRLLYLNEIRSPTVPPVGLL